MAKNKKGSSKNIVIIIGLIVMAGMVGYIFAQGNGSQHKSGNSYGSIKTIPTTGHHGLTETRPILSPEYFSGKVAQIYKWASEAPEPFDALYCYCKCKENPSFRHKTLLTCYTDGHASKCGVCLHEGQMAWELTQQGKSPAEIRTIVDNYYAKQIKQHF